MKNLFRSYHLLKPILVMMIILTALPLYGQKIKPMTSGYVPVGNLKVYYEVYGEGRPLVLLHGAFMTIDTNWGPLIPELSKTGKLLPSNCRDMGIPLIQTENYHMLL